MPNIFSVLQEQQQHINHLQNALVNNIPGRDVRFIDTVCGEKDLYTQHKESVRYAEMNLEHSEYDLDLAIEEGFFAVQDLSKSLCFIRQSSFSLNTEGALVDSMGHQLMGVKLLDDKGQKLQEPALIQSKDLSPLSFNLYQKFFEPTTQVKFLGLNLPKFNDQGQLLPQAEQRIPFQVYDMGGNAIELTCQFQCAKGVWKLNAVNDATGKNILSKNMDFSFNQQGSLALRNPNDPTHIVLNMGQKGDGTPHEIQVDFSRTQNLGSQYSLVPPIKDGNAPSDLKKLSIKDGKIWGSLASGDTIALAVLPTCDFPSRDQMSACFKNDAFYPSDASGSVFFKTKDCPLVQGNTMASSMQDQNIQLMRNNGAFRTMNMYLTLYAKRNAMEEKIIQASAS